QGFAIDDEIRDEPLELIRGYAAAMRMRLDELDALAQRALRVDVNELGLRKAHVTSTDVVCIAAGSWTGAQSISRPTPPRDKSCARVAATSRRGRLAMTASRT